MVVKTSSKKKNKQNEKIALFLIAIASGVVQYLVAAYVLTTLWSWFILNRFTTHVITFSNAIGLLIVLNFIHVVTMDASHDKTEASSFDEKMIKGSVKNVTNVIALYPALLLAAYVWHLFV